MTTKDKYGHEVVFTTTDTDADMRRKVLAAFDNPSSPLHELKDDKAGQAAVVLGGISGAMLEATEALERAERALLVGVVLSGEPMETFRQAGKDMRTLSRTYAKALTTLAQRFDISIPEPLMDGLRNLQRGDH